MNSLDSSRDWDVRFLQLAAHVSTWSKDPSTKVGAVITDEYRRIRSVGFNGFPRGVADNNRLANREEKYPIIVHGEINALLFAGGDISNCTLYTYPFGPCTRRAAQFIQSRIARVVYPHTNNPRWVESVRLAEALFLEAGISVTADPIRVTSIMHVPPDGDFEALILNLEPSTRE